MRRKARVFVGDSIVRKTNTALNKGDDMIYGSPGTKLDAITEIVDKNHGSREGIFWYA